MKGLRVYLDAITLPVPPEPTITKSYVVVSLVIAGEITASQIPTITNRANILLILLFIL